MSDLISVLETPILIDEPVKAKKVRKARAPLSPEKKEKLLANLAKAREKAAANRKAKKEALASGSSTSTPPPKQAKKRVAKKAPEPVHEVPHVIQQKIDPRDIELAELRDKVKSMTLQDVVKKPRKPRVKKSAAIPDTDDEVDIEQTTTTHHTPERTVRPKSPKKVTNTPVQKIESQGMVLSGTSPLLPIDILKKKKLFGRKKRR